MDVAPTNRNTPPLALPTDPPAPPYDSSGAGPSRTTHAAHNADEGGPLQAALPSQLLQCQCTCMPQRRSFAASGEDAVALSVLQTHMETQQQPLLELNSLAVAFADVVNATRASRMEDSRQNLGWDAAYLSGLATIAALFSIGDFSLMGSVRVRGEGSVSGATQRTLVAAGTLSMGFDLNSTVLALLVARTRLRRASVMQDLLDRKSVLATDIVLASKQVAPFRHKLEDFNKRANTLLEDILEQRHLKDHHTRGREEVVVALMYGRFAFSLGLFGLVFDQEPVGEAAVLLTFVLGLVYCVVWLDARQNPKTWFMRRFLTSGVDTVRRSAVGDARPAQRTTTV